MMESLSSRSRGRSAAVAGVAFLLGSAIPVAFMIGAGVDDPTPASSATQVATTTVDATATATATATVTATVTVTAMVTETVTAQVTPAEADSSDASTGPSPAQPRGTLLVQAGPEGGFGQTFPEGRCAVWRTGFINQSDTAIDQITMAPPGGEYTGEWNGHSSPTRAAAKPAPAVLDVYIAAGQSSALEYKTCTSTPPPGPKFEYSAFAPEFVTFHWKNGQVGRACFQC